MSMDALITALLDLSAELPEFPQPILVGGGFGLYIKQRHLETQEGLETLIPGDLWPPARATEDVDLLVPTEVIVDPEHTRSIRSALDKLGYKPVIEFHQFAKQTPFGLVRVDLLTPAVPDELRGRVKIKKYRVRSHEGVELHAYLTEEALELGLEPYEVSVPGSTSAGKPATVRVSVPNPFTYLLMKLHAFRDRVDDERKNLASHHSLDLYRIVAMMTRDEYDLVRELAGRHANASAVLNAADIVAELFRGDSAVGKIRLLTGARDAGLEQRDIRANDFQDALSELFPGGDPT